MRKLSEYLETFPEIGELGNLFQCNVAIGGSYALRLHGLEVRTSNELDLIVYPSSEEVINYILDVTKGDQGSPQREIGGDRRRSYKIERNGLTVDFLLEEELEMEQDLLIAQGLVKVQSIKVILDAKRSYGRDKDKKDFDNMIKNNFAWT